MRCSRPPGPGGPRHRPTRRDCRPVTWMAVVDRWPAQSVAATLDLRVTEVYGSGRSMRRRLLAADERARRRSTADGRVDLGSLCRRRVCPEGRVAQPRLAGAPEVFIAPELDEVSVERRLGSGGRDQRTDSRPAAANAIAMRASTPSSASDVSRTRSAGSGWNIRGLGT